MTTQERETIIRYTEHEPDAEVYTFNRKLRNRIVKAGFEGEVQEDGSTIFTVPKEYIRVQKPGGASGRTWTDEQRAEVRDRLAAARQSRLADEDDDEEEVVPAKKSKAKAKVATKAKPGRKPKAKVPIVIEEDEDDDDTDLVDEVDDDDEEEEVVEVVSRKPRSTRRNAPGAL